MLGVWPFVQIYFMSPPKGPVVLDHDQQEKASSFKNANRPAFDFEAAIKRRQGTATTTAIVTSRVINKPVETPMVIDDDDEESVRDQIENKRKSKLKKNKLRNYVDSQAEEDDD
jgi:hypothetical protein